MNSVNRALEYVKSADGTSIAIDRTGDGPPVVLISGGSVDRRSNDGLAVELASQYMVLNYDRRGRGDSGDTLPYAIEREIEDIAAVVEAADGPAFLYGSSSGAALGLMAAEKLGQRIRKLAMWEPPFIKDPAARPPGDHVQAYERFVAEGRRGDAVEYFMARVVRLPAEFVAFARSQPWWADQEKIAHTLAYDGRIMGDYEPPVELARSVTTPTLILTGGASFPFMHETARLLADALPNGETRVVQGQEHNVDPGVLAPALRSFFAR